MHHTDCPDWQLYSLQELHEALAGLDHHRYPDRVTLIEGLIRDRLRAPPEPVREQNPGDQMPDWASYSLNELEQALDGLDRHLYPDREALIQGWIDQRCGKNRDSDHGS